MLGGFRADLTAWEETVTAAAAAEGAGPADDPDRAADAALDTLGRVATLRDVVQPLRTGAVAHLATHWDRFVHSRWWVRYAQWLSLIHI